MSVIRSRDIGRSARGNVPPKSSSKDPISFCKHLHKARNIVERLFRKIKFYRRIATIYNKTAENSLAAFKFVAVRVWLRGNEPVSQD